MSDQFEFSTMRQLGKQFGVGSHTIGKWLKLCGLRNEDGKPSYEAHQGGYVNTAPNPNGYGYFYSWHTENTVKALESAGHEQIKKESNSPPTAKLAGPFEARPSGDNGFEVVDANGIVGFWAYGQSNAENLVKLMNASDNDIVF